MFGGVASTYCRFQIVGEPFKKGKYYYVQVLHPITKSPKEVRWYTDAAHANNMPKTNSKDFAGKIFGFSSEKDSIIAIPSMLITSEEEEKYFFYNWKRGGNWKYGTFFGGVWFAPKGTKIPPIHSTDGIFECSWDNFKAEGKRNFQNSKFWKEI